MKGIFRQNEIIVLQYIKYKYPVIFCLPMERVKKVKIVESLTVPLSMAFLFENMFFLKFATGITSLIVS